MKKLTENVNILFDCFDVRFVPPFSKNAKLSNGQKSQENRTNMDIILLCLAKPPDKQGIPLVHITYPPLSKVLCLIGKTSKCLLLMYLLVISHHGRTMRKFIKAGHDRFFMSVCHIRLLFPCSNVGFSFLQFHRLMRSTFFNKRYVNVGVVICKGYDKIKRRCGNL